MILGRRNDEFVDGNFINVAVVACLEEFDAPHLFYISYN